MDVITLEQEAGSVWFWGSEYPFVSTGEEKIRIPVKVIKIRFDRKRHSADSVY